MEKAIIFDGEDAHDIGIDYFFQHPVIERISKKDIVHYYKATAIYRDTLKLVIKATRVNESTTESIKEQISMLNRVIKGQELLKTMMRDLIGEETCASVVVLVEELIKEDNDENYS